MGEDGIHLLGLRDAPGNRLDRPGAAAYPGLEAAEGAINLRLFNSPDEARDSHKQGVEALLLRRFAKDYAFMERNLVLPAEYQKSALYFGGEAAVEKMLAASLRMDVFRKNIRGSEEFKSYGETVVRLLFERAHVLWGAAAPVLDAHARVRADLAAIEKAKAANKASGRDPGRDPGRRGAPRPGRFPGRFAIDRLETWPATSRLAACGPSGPRTSPRRT